MNTKTDNQYSLNPHLRDDNSHFSKIKVIRQNSPIMLFENASIKIKKYYRRLHLDINIFRAILTLLLIVSTSFIIADRNKVRSEKVVDSGQLLGLGITILFAMSNLHSQYHHNKLSRASQYIKYWNSEEFSPLRETIKTIKREEFSNKKYLGEFNSDLFDDGHSLIARFKEYTDGCETLNHIQSNILNRLLNNSSERSDVVQVFNFFEHMGQDVKLHVADSDYLKDFFYLIVIDYYELFRKYIEYEQFQNCNRHIYCNFVYLAQTWEKEGTPPELPIICKRPLIITSRDLKIQKVENSRKQEKQQIPSSAHYQVLFIND